MESSAGNDPADHRCYWPHPGVREQRLLGGPPRTAGFGRGDRKRL